MLFVWFVYICMCFVSYSDMMIPLLPTSVTEPHASGADDSRVSMENEQLRGENWFTRSSTRILGFRSSVKRSNTVGCWNFILSSNGSTTHTTCLRLRERETMHTCRNWFFQSSLHDIQEDGREQTPPQEKKKLESVWNVYYIGRKSLCVCPVHMKVSSMKSENT